MNTFMNELKNEFNKTYTDNGAVVYSSTLSAIYDMFAFGGAYRQKSDTDCQLLFKKAYEENKTFALKCLFYLRDIRGGQGERRFFRICFNWLAKNDSIIAQKLLKYIPKFGRWDDIIYSTLNTSLEYYGLDLCAKQLFIDYNCSKAVSLCAKWMPSINASSTQTKIIANKLCKQMALTHKQYRQLLSNLRRRINVLEKLMSEGKWDQIEFDKIPSKAGLKYRNAFARRDLIKEKYHAFVMDKTTKVNANTLYPYDIVKKAIILSDNNEVEREIINKYWENQKDYLNGKPCKMMCVCDTSGSMCGCAADAPINVAIGLSLYCAERVGGPFKNHYISFSSRPQLIETTGIDFVDKVKRIYRTNLCENTDLLATFRLLKNISLKAKPEDRIDTLVVLSDMQIDYMTYGWNQDNIELAMDAMAKEWEAEGLQIPRLVYWNINAKNPVILQKPNSRVSFVSGCSPTLFEQVIKSKSGIELMLEVLLNDRYSIISAS